MKERGKKVKERSLQGAAAEPRGLRQSDAAFNLTADNDPRFAEIGDDPRFLEMPKK